LKNSDEGIRLSAALALGNIGSGPEVAVPYLIALLNENSGIRATAARALGKMGSAAKLAVPELITVMGEEGGGFVDDRFARDSATGALIKIGQDAVPALITALSDVNHITHSRAAYALGGIGEEAVPALLATLKHEDPNVRRRAAFALGWAGRASVPALLEALQDNNNDVRKGVAYALYIINAPTSEVITSLENIVNDESNNLDLRRVAASALEQFGVDMQSFFTTYKLISPKNAVCSRDQFEFDVYTGKCLLTYGESMFVAGVASILKKLCQLLKC
jgi:HEAT repeat protein